MILLAAFTMIFLIVCVTLQPFAIYGGTGSAAVLIALLVCLIPTTIGGLLSAIGIAGMDRLVQRNVLGDERPRGGGRGRRRTLLLDKTGTITSATATRWRSSRAPGVDERELAEVARLAHSPTRPRGQPSWFSAKERTGCASAAPGREAILPFTAQTRMSGIDIEGSQIRKGAGMPSPAGRAARCRRSWSTSSSASRAGGTPLVVGDGREPARHHRPEGHSEARHARAIRSAPRDGHQDGDDHGRQSAHGRRHRRRKPASTTSSPRPRPKPRWPTSRKSRRAASSSR